MEQESQACVIWGMERIPPDLSYLVSESVTRSRDAGLDSLSATRNAVRLVRWARPDLTPDEAWAAVELILTDRCVA